MNKDTKPCFQRTASGSVEPAQLREPFTLSTRLSHKAARDDRPHFSLMSPLPCVLWVSLLWLPCSHLRVVSWHPWPWLAYEPTLGGDHGAGLQMSTCSLPYFSDLLPTWGPLRMSVHAPFWYILWALPHRYSRWIREDGQAVRWIGSLGPSLLPVSSAQVPAAAGAALPSLGFRFSILSEHRVLGALECLLDLWFKAFPIPFSLLGSSESLHCFFFFLLILIYLADPILVVTCGI